MKKLIFLFLLGLLGLAMVIYVIVSTSPRYPREANPYSRGFSKGESYGKETAPLPKKPPRKRTMQYKNIP